MLELQSFRGQSTAGKPPIRDQRHSVTFGHIGRKHNTTRKPLLLFVLFGLLLLRTAAAALFLLLLNDPPRRTRLLPGSLTNFRQHS